jgi:hypothetical protein
LVFNTKAPPWYAELRLEPHGIEAEPQNRIPGGTPGISCKSLANAHK